MYIDEIYDDDDDFKQTLRWLRGKRKILSILSYLGFKLSGNDQLHYIMRKKLFFSKKNI